MTRPEPRAEINMSGIPVNGIGGLGLVAVSVLMTVVLPEAWWLLVLGVTGGIVLGGVMALARRRHVPSGPSGDDPTILFRPEPVNRSGRSHAGVLRSDPDAPTRVPFSAPLGVLTIHAAPVRDRS
jgi:hypothetical protein